MLITLLKSKIHKATITSTELHYEGSIAVDPALLKAAGLLPYEKVAVLNFNNGKRFETYIIVGKRGEIGLRGPAAKLGRKGHKVIIVSYVQMTAAEAGRFKPKKVFVDRNNNIK